MGLESHIRVRYAEKIVGDQKIIRSRSSKAIWIRSIWLLLPFILFSGTGFLLSAQIPTPVRDWNALSPQEAAKGYPVELPCTILCYDYSWGQLYVHDGQNTIYLNPRWFTNDFKAGQTIVVKGTTTVENGYATLSNATARVTGTRHLPVPRSLKLSNLSENRAEWVQVQGKVRVAEASRDRVTLVIEEDRAKALVYVMQTSANTQFRDLIDSWVKVLGINASQTDEAGRLSNSVLFAASMAHVTVTKASELDRRLIPVAAIERLLARPLGDWTNAPVHINGTVGSYVPGSSLVVKDPTGTLEAEVIQQTEVKPGQRVDAWGFFTVKNNRIFLADAYFEVRGGIGKSESVYPNSQRPKASQLQLADIHALRALPKSEANQHEWKRVRGVLTYVDTEWRVVFVEDGTDAVFLEIGQPELASGQFVEVIAQTDAGGFAPQLINCTATVLGKTNLPPPIKIDLRDAANGQFDSRFVEMEGVVRRVSKNGPRITLSLSSRSGKFSAVVFDPTPAPPPDQLVDSLIKIQGACGSVVNSRGQLAGVNLQVPGTNELQILDPSAADPFAIGPTIIAKVATFNADWRASRRVKVDGVVTMVVPGQGVYLQDGSGGIRIQGHGMDEVGVGDLLEVVGFPGLLGFSPCLEEAIVRNVGKSPPPEAVKTTGNQIISRGTHDGLVVELEAEVLQSLAKVAQPKLLLQDGPIIFTATIVRPGKRSEIPNPTPGSIVKVRGVCSIEGNENNEPTTFQLLVAHPSDVAVVKAAPWWTIRHSMLLISGTAFGGLLAAAWVLSLRRQVRAQTEIIERNQKELLLASRQAGMAEIATSVLHNVGNVLNSVNVSANVVSEKIRSSGVALLARAVALIEEHRDDLGTFITQHQRGKNLPHFLSSLSVRLKQENEILLREVDDLLKNVEHIKEIVTMQQSFARMGGVVQEVRIADVVEDALRMEDGSLSGSGIIIHRKFDPSAGNVTVDKHKLLQILVNIIRNARNACCEVQIPKKEITLTLDRKDGRVCISVQDNGVGISPENLTKIFSFGFTTRKKGHGFGLHSGALAAREMGGRLTAESEGPGRGAKFTLVLPLNPAERLESN